MAQHHESAFEKELCEYLAARGWLYSATDAGYDRQRALFPDDIFAWLEETQPEELANKVKQTKTPGAQNKAKDGVIDRLSKLLDQGQPVGGALKVLRSGFKDAPAAFDMMQKRPEQAVNPNVNAKYTANRLRVMRQVHYSSKNNNSIDLVLFVNGIPVATLELKTDFTQSVADARKQYQRDRLPAGEPLLGFGTRALVHFAVSNDEVWMTTKLEGPKTRFLPFNRGNHGHKGNAPDPEGSPTTYLWRDVLQRDMWLDIVGKFIHYETTKTKDPVTGQQKKTTNLIFPRYHQLEAVTALVADSKAMGAGQRYLVQHSAGSGKTRTIAWTAHRLATLHDVQNQKIFDSVIIITDRTVLDDQLQEAVKEIETKTGIVATINTKEAAKYGLTSKSALLAQTLAAGKLIVVVTLQTFPFILKEIEKSKSLRGKRFAVIADEAHSSQTGQASAELKKALSDQEAADVADGGEIDVESVLAATASAKAETPNISFYAFTATPKSKTLELFGTPDPATGLSRPFHLYTMQQAIEEEFILDVLKNYTTYDTAFQLAQKVDEGQMKPLPTLDQHGNLVDEKAARKGLMNWVQLHPTNIAQKVQIIVEHFEANVKHLLGGQAKAMVVTGSRKAAIKYKKAIDAYIAKHHYSDATSLVAFSGEVTFTDLDFDGYPSDAIHSGDKFTEASMNPGVKDLRNAFDTPEYRVMIVANKFQTGFDQPKLCAMYVDKPLAGVAAVQTLSRLNRAMPGKATMVLDFANKAEDILAAFKPYFEEAEITTTTDPNLLHDLATKLDATGIYSPEEVEAVATSYVQGKGNNALTAAVQPVKQRFIAARNAAREAKDASKLEELEQFRSDVSTFVRLYDFLSQIINFEDTSIEKQAIFSRYLATQIRPEERSETVDLSDVTLEGIKHSQGETVQIKLGDGEVVPLGPSFTAAGSRKPHDPRLALMAAIIASLNEQFAGEGFQDHQQQSWVEELVVAMKHDEDLVAQAVVNNEEQFLASPTLRDAVTIAVSETHGAHSKMVDLFHTRSGVEIKLNALLGRLLYMDLREPVDGQPTT
ncbi:type I restriction endonuclease subunit R [Tessaracoccus antarcticus]|uniref:Type I restriction endonuclease subunit R n=1 Tax=Tessaracoccus antarcticus TaxID=2479848 RepID=A0A3M0G6C0_9ACTN|nr:type I restriction endonuclease [Tessaracoccus antarcticus]RMB57852.1 type I restriction endonuclease subunit R [Tessaracoccus antarcticus]